MSEILTNPKIIEDINDSVKNDTWTGPLILASSVLICSLLPIAALLYSLLHAIEQK